jgi:hypothetical protein
VAALGWWVGLAAPCFGGTFWLSDSTPLETREDVIESPLPRHEAGNRSRVDWRVWWSFVCRSWPIFPRPLLLASTRVSLEASYCICVLIF